MNAIARWLRSERIPFVYSLAASVAVCVAIWVLIAWVFYAWGVL